MSFDSVIASAFKLGAGVSLETVVRSASFRERKRSSIRRFETNSIRSDRGVALRAGPVLFGNSLNYHGDAKAAIKEMRSLKVVKGKPDLDALERDCLIEELGERLIKTAEKKLSPSSRDMATAFKNAKTADDQAALLRGLVTKIISNRWNKLTENGKEKPDVNIYSHLDYFFEDQKIEQFLPACFERLNSKDFPNCLGVSILLAAWAELAGAKYYFATELIENTEAELMYQGLVYDALLGLTHDLVGDDAKIMRKRIIRERDRVVRIRNITRDWHHGIVIQLRDKRWFYVDPFSRLSDFFPPSWEISSVDQVLTKYGEMVPGLSMVAQDHGAQKKYIEKKIDEFFHNLSLAQRAKMRLSFDPGLQTAGDILVYAPELKTLCRLLRKNNPRINEDARKKRLPLYATLYHILYAWVYTLDEASLREIKQVHRMAARFRIDRKFRRKKLDDLIGHFSDQIRRSAENIEHMIHPALDIGLPKFTVGLTVISNLSSWTEDGVAGTLLIEHGNGQMFWHEALSPIPEFDDLTEKEFAHLDFMESVIRGLPQHRRVQLKLEATRRLFAESRSRKGS